MIHIVFNEADVTVLQQAIALDASLEGEVLQIKDDFAVGPIANIYETEGYQQRRDWWQNALQYSPYTEQIDLVDDKMTVFNLIKQLNEDESLEVWIWMGQNQHDVCGYYWLMPQLRDFQGRIHVLYLNNLPFINDKGGIFYPSWLSEIQPKEFLKAKKLARPITLSEFEIDPDEWQKLCRENSGVRLLEGGKKIVSKGYDHYDAEMLTMITAEPQKLSKILSNIFSKTKIKTGDVFLVWRIRKLAEFGDLEIVGDWEKGWKEICVKVRTTIVNDSSD